MSESDYLDFVDYMNVVFDYKRDEMDLFKWWDAGMKLVWQKDPKTVKDYADTIIRNAIDLNILWMYRDFRYSFVQLQEMFAAAAADVDVDVDAESKRTWFLYRMIWDYKAIMKALYTKSVLSISR